MALSKSKEYTKEYVIEALFDQAAAARQIDDLDTERLLALEQEVLQKFERFLWRVRNSDNL